MRVMWLALVCLLCTGAFAAKPTPFSILVSGGTVTLVPLSTLAEFLQADLLTDRAATAQRIFRYGDLSITFTQNKATVIANGKPLKLTVAPLQYQGEWYVPLTPVARLLKLPFEWELEVGVVMHHPVSGTRLALPMLLMMPELGNSTGVPFGFHIGNVPYVQLDPFVKFAGAALQKKSAGLHILSFSGRSVSVRPNASEFTADGQSCPLPSPTILYRNRLYIPARELAKAMALQYTEDRKAGTVTLHRSITRETMVIDVRQVVKR